jgi:N-acetylneuraminic acid mutarotase
MFLAFAAVASATTPWSAIADLPDGQTCSSAAVLNGTLYVVGGTDGFAWNKPVAFDPTHDSWSTIPDMLTPRDHQATVGLNGKVYALGGSGANSNNTALVALKSVEFFDPTITGRWSAAVDMPTARYYLGAAALGGKVYVVGGSEITSTPSALKSADVFDSSTGKWSAIADMSTARSGSPGTVALNGKIYVMGGDTGDGPNQRQLASAEVFDPDTGRWSAIADMSTARNSMGAAALDGKVYVMGGFDGSSVLKSAEVFDPATGRWSVIADMSTARHWPAAAALNGKVYAVGGDNAVDPAAFKSGEAFDPIAGTSTPGTKGLSTTVIVILAAGAALVVGSAMYFSSKSPVEDQSMQYKLEKGYVAK